MCGAASKTIVQIYFVQIALLKLHSCIRVKDNLVGDLDINTQLDTSVSIKSYYCIVNQIATA